MSIRTIRQRRALGQIPVMRDYAPDINRERERGSRLDRIERRGFIFAFCSLGLAGVVLLARLLGWTP